MTQICVAGVGAVGSTLAARLAHTGATVNLLARGARLTQLRRDGLRVELSGTSIEARLNASDQADFGVQDVVFIATKAPALGAVLPTLAPLIAPRTMVVPLVNGIPWWYFQGVENEFEGHRIEAVDPKGALHNALPAAHLVGSVVYFTARLLPSGIVSAPGPQRMVVGEIGTVGVPGEIGAAARAAGLAKLLTDSGINAAASTCIRADLWTKVALNLATNPLSVVSKATLREQFTNPVLLAVVSAVLEEAVRVAIDYGVTPSLSLDQMIDTGRQAGDFETSMLQDYRAGRALELDAIAMSVLELAGKIGRPMPATRLIVNLCAHRAARRGQRTERQEPSSCLPLL